MNLRKDHCRNLPPEQNDPRTRPSDEQVRPSGGFPMDEPPRKRRLTNPGAIRAKEYVNSAAAASRPGVAPFAGAAAGVGAASR